MFKRNFGAKIAFFLLAVIMVFTACQSTPKTIADGGNELAPWKGEWITSDYYKNDSSLESVYKETADAMPFYTVDGLKEAFTEMYATPIVKAKFDGTNTVKFTILDENNKEVEVKGTYIYKGKVEDKEYPGNFWETFELAKDVRGLSGAKYMIAFPPHGHGEDAPLHWHARFGKSSIDALVNASNWPTYYSARMTKDWFLKETSTSLKYIPKTPFIGYTGFKKWMNSSSIYDNKSEAVQAAYKKIIAEFKGKNPKGGDFTREEIIAEMKKVYGTDEDFSYIEFIASAKKNEAAVNELVFYKGNKEVFRSSYTRVASTIKPGRLTVMADKKGAGKFALICFTSVHGNPAHCHFWYGATAEEAKAVKFTPTVISADLSDAEIAARVESSCRRVLGGLVK